MTVALACALTAWHPIWGDAYDLLRGTVVPPTGEVFTWDGSDLEAAPAADTTGLLDGTDDPAGAQARTLAVPAKGITLDLVWEAPLTISEVRLETYTDAFGTGRRLGIAADTTTAAGINCLNARLTRNGATTAVQWCSRSDQHPPRGTVEGKIPPSGDQWAPDRLFITQTANLTPPGYETTLVDYFGFGDYTGNAFNTGLWPTGTGPQTGAEPYCDDLHLRVRLDDLHISDRYDDPEEHHSFHYETLATATPAYPVEDRLISQACVPVDQNFFNNAIVLGPFETHRATPLAGWTHYNASTHEPRPVRTALVLDLRSCNADFTDCASTDTTDRNPHHDGPGAAWMSDLLGHD